MLKLRYIRDRFSPVSFKFMSYEESLQLAKDSVDSLTAVINREKDRDAASDNVQATNEMNYKIAQENNQLQYLMFNEANEFNAYQAALNRYFIERQARESRDFNAVEARLDRDFQSAEAQKSREWNAVGAQIDRAKEAGINPALVAGSMSGAVSPAMAGGAAATSVPASGTAAMASSLPHLATPTMQNTLPLYQTSLATQAQLGKMFSEIQKNVADAKKVDSERQNNETYHKFQEQLLERNIKVDDATAAKLYQDVKQSETYIMEIDQKVEVAKAQAMLFQNEAEIARIDSIWRDAFDQAQYAKVFHEAGYSEILGRYIAAKMPYEFGLLRSEQALNEAKAESEKLGQKLTQKDIETADEIITGLKADNAQKALDLTVNRYYQMKNATENYRQNQAQTKKAEFESGSTVMVIREINGSVNAGANAIQAATSAYNARTGRINANKKR